MEGGREGGREGGMKTLEGEANHSSQWWSLPSHFSPCFSSPNMMIPQWSQNVGALYVCTVRRWGHMVSSYSCLAFAVVHERRMEGGKYGRGGRWGGREGGREVM